MSDLREVFHFSSGHSRKLLRWIALYRECSECVAHVIQNSSPSLSVSLPEQQFSVRCPTLPPHVTLPHVSEVQGTVFMKRLSQKKSFVEKKILVSNHSEPNLMIDPGASYDRIFQSSASSSTDKDFYGKAYLKRRLLDSGKLEVLVCNVNGSTLTLKWEAADIFTGGLFQKVRKGHQPIRVNFCRLQSRQKFQLYLSQ
ncbi:hypothetical protein R1flu_018700 [Riccia fluitans]|uniref:Uncharacterized protein n=1 Tax=Riccia fluitans TaxID=41844 RepID=A0ABD1ZHM5_9MARC